MIFPEKDTAETRGGFVTGMVEEGVLPPQNKGVAVTIPTYDKKKKVMYILLQALAILHACTCNKLAFIDLSGS